MCHGAVMDFARRAIGDYRQRGGVIARVLDVGSFDMNGSTRVFFGPEVEYVGLDIHAGKGVDWVGPAHEYPAGGWDGRLFDALLSTEALEHDPHWRLTLRACAQLVRPAGLVMLTCATGTRAPHALHLWPDGYYANLGQADIEPALRSAAVFGEYAVVRGGEDLQFTGRRLGGLDCLDATGVPYALAGVQLAREVVASPNGEVFASRGATYDLAASEAVAELGRRRLLGRLG